MKVLKGQRFVLISVVKSAKGITRAASLSRVRAHKLENFRCTHIAGHLYNLLFSFFPCLVINYNEYALVTFGDIAKNKKLKSESEADRVLLYHLYTLR